MEILLHKKADICACSQDSSEYKKRLKENAGKWIQVETEYLFNDQYNTPFGRVFDSMVAAVRNDQRGNMGKCRYCGAMVRRGEEEKHFTEQEKKSCDGCFWYREKVIDTKTSTEKKRIENGTETTIKVVYQKIAKKCCYSESYCYTAADCKNKECRKLGIEWFTPENTFFLQYPNGIQCQQIIFNKENIKVGSYYLEFLDFAGYYRLRNSRAKLEFFVDDKKSGVYRIVKRSFGNSHDVEKIPAEIKKQALNIIDFRKMILQTIINGNGKAAELAALHDLPGAAVEILDQFKKDKKENNLKAWCSWCGGLPGDFVLPFETEKQKDFLKSIGVKNIRRLSGAEIADTFYIEVEKVLKSWAAL